MIHKISELIAKVLSVILHPILLPFWAYCIVLLHDDTDLFQIPYFKRWLIGGLIFVLTAAVPAMLMLLMKQLRLIQSLSMTQKEERTIPIIISAVFFYLTYYLLNSVQIAPVFAYYMLGATLLSIISMLITFWYKISLHMIGIGGMVAAFWGISILAGIHYVPSLIIVILFAGLLAYSRLKLKAHTSAEVYIGFGLGFMLFYSLLEFAL